MAPSAAQLNKALAAAEARIAQLEDTLESTRAQLCAKEEELAEETSLNGTLRRTIQKQRKELEALMWLRARKKPDVVDENQPVLGDLQLDAMKQAEAALDDEDEATATPEDDGDEQTPKTRKNGKSGRKHPGRLPLPSHLERVTVEHDLPEDEKVDPITGKPLKLMRVEEVERLDAVPATLRVIVDLRPIYALPDNKGVVHAELPQLPIAKAKVTSGFLAQVAVKRYIEHLPYYRQSQSLALQDVPMHRNALSRWMNTLGCEVLWKLYEALGANILGRDYVGFDDSGMPMMVKGLGKLYTARLWICRAGTDPPYVYYKFTMTKEKEAATELLGDFQGYAQADAYGGHDEVMAKTGVIEVGCWAHLTRKLKDAVSAHPRQAPHALKLIRQLYDIEEQCQLLGPEARGAVRQAKAAPIVDAFFELLAGFRALPKSPLNVATTYAANQEQALRCYLKDGRLAIDNNAVERGIRPLGIGRKNWGFAGGERGARAAAVMMSLLYSARACNLNPWLYLKDILDRIHTHPADRLHELLPAVWQPLPENADLGVPLRVHPHPDQTQHRPV
jgi:transposase